MASTLTEITQCDHLDWAVLEATYIIDLLIKLQHTSLNFTWGFVKSPHNLAVVPSARIRFRSLCFLLIRSLAGPSYIVIFPVVVGANIVI